MCSAIRSPHRHTTVSLLSSPARMRRDAERAATPTASCQNDKSTVWAGRSLFPPGRREGLLFAPLTTKASVSWRVEWRVSFGEAVVIGMARRRPEEHTWWVVRGRGGGGEGPSLDHRRIGAGGLAVTGAHLCLVCTNTAYRQSGCLVFRRQPGTDGQEHWQLAPLARRAVGDRMHKRQTDAA